jgi:predicted Zn-dependent protease
MSTRLPSALLAVAVATLLVSANAALDFGKINKSLNDATKALDTGKDAAKVAKGAVGIGPQEERKIGAAAGLELIGRYGGLVRDPEIARRVNLIGRGLARYSSRPSLDWCFGVLDSPTVNAFSTPGGFVFITRGLYEQAATDDELAGILGHEIAHIVNRNALKIIERNEAASGGLNLLKKRSSDVRQASAVADRVGSMLGYDIAGLVGKIVESGFDAPTEFTADRDGRELAASTGYAAGGLRTVLTDLQAKGENRKTMFSVHPPLADRIKRLPNDPPVAAAPADGKND